MDALSLVAPPQAIPVTVDEAKAHLRVVGDEENALILGLIRAATQYLDGRDGVLGFALMPQQWRQDFSGFSRRMRLRLDPLISVDEVTYTDADGLPVVIPATDYRLRIRATGAEVGFADEYQFPHPLRGSDVSVTFTAGRDVVPAPIKQAILLHVGTLYQHREMSAEKWQPTMAYEALIAPWRRF